MRIISPFHDYYDSAMGYGQDPQLIYKRTPSVCEVPYEKLGSRMKEVIKAIPDTEWGWLNRNACIGFCGKSYPMLLAEPVGLSMDSVVGNRAFETVSLERFLKIELDFYRYSNMDRERELKFARQSYEAFCEKLSGRDIGHEIHRLVDAPVFLTVFTHWDRPMPVTVFANPRLANFKFASKVEPFSAFQEIAMFLGSQLTNEDQAPRNVGGDKIIAASKGFDEQSFRTAAPGQKKLSRAKNRARKRGSIPPETEDPTGS